MRVKVSLQGNIVEITETDNMGAGKCSAVKISGDEWVDPATGEVHEYRRGTDAESRADNIRSLYVTFRNLRALINANCVDASRLKWITLTYKELMTDTKRLYVDFRNFMKRYRRKWGACEYIAVMEPQRRGAWHVHMIAIYPTMAPFVKNAELRECWGQGYVKVTKVDGIDNVGAYLSAYLADLDVTGETDEGTGTEVRLRDGSSKRVIKGKRLELYPPRMQFVRHSNGVAYPVEYYVEDAVSAAGLEQLLRGKAETYVKDFTWVDDGGMRHKVRKRYYNLLREGDGASNFHLLREIEG